MGDWQGAPVALILSVLSVIRSLSTGPLPKLAPGLAIFDVETPLNFHVADLKIVDTRQTIPPDSPRSTERSQFWRMT